MIEITTHMPDGRRIDSASAETPEEAVAAARTLLREASVQSHVPRPTATFRVDGVPVAAELAFADLTDWRSLS